MSGAYDGGYGDSQSGTQASPGRSAAKNTLRPVTIKQILDAQTPHDDNTFVIDEVEIGNVTFVAQIRSVSDQETTSTYKMEDGTGSIEVKQFKDNRNLMVEDEGLQVNSYARVLGNIKQFNNKRNITTQSVKPVTDFNEIQCHFLEVTAAHLHFTRGPPESQQARNTSGGGMAYQQGGATSYGEDTTMGGTGGAVAGMGLLPPGMSANARKIYAHLKTRQDASEGVHVSMIAQATGVPTTETYKAVDELLSHGVCFTTIDDEHVACIDF
ncbi:replication factor A protein 2 [Arthrobotrys musiformis]|uniref:Replication factor A protein 2 n=1 Tax=Arthrobotrys musiformis TaxID=47236 RepID=A0AAV9W1A5_9PEZI